MKIFNKNKLLIIFFLIIQLVYKNVTAQNIDISEDSFNKILKCTENCSNIIVHAPYRGMKSYSYNQGSCCCFPHRCPTRYDIYYTHRYGDADASNYTYGKWGDWFEKEKWDCMGKWTRCWKASMSAFRPQCIWSSGYGYERVFDMPYLKERIYNSSREYVLEKAREYCRSKTKYPKECYKHCFSKVDLTVNNTVVKSIDDFIDALTKEQAVNGLIRKIGTKGMLEYYDPNKVY